MKFSCGGASWILDPNNCMKIRKNPGSILLGLWILLHPNIMCQYFSHSHSFFNINILMLIDICHFINSFSVKLYFNRDVNRGCLVCMFSSRFLGRKFLINLRRQFRVRKIFFVYIKFFVYKFLWDLQSFHFVFKITNLKMRNLCSRLLFH